MVRSLGLVGLRYPRIRYALSESFMPRRAKRDTRYPKIRYALSVSLMPRRMKRDTLRNSYPIMPRRALTKNMVRLRDAFLRLLSLVESLFLEFERYRAENNNHKKTWTETVTVLPVASLK